MTRNDPSHTQIALLKELFEAHLGPLREDIRDMKNDQKIAVSAVRADLTVSHELARSAHTRIDKHENRFLGMVTGLTFGGGTIGALAAKYLPALFS